MTSVASADVSDRRLYTVTTTDHTAFPVIATAVGLAVLPVFGLIRYLIRRATEIGADDILLFVSSAAAIAQSGIILRATTSGLGQSTSELQADEVAEAEKACHLPSTLMTLRPTDRSCSLAVLHKHNLLGAVRRLFEGQHSKSASETWRNEATPDVFRCYACFRSALGSGIRLCSRAEVRVVAAVEASWSALSWRGKSLCPPSLSCVSDNSIFR